MIRPIPSSIRVNKRPVFVLVSIIPITLKTLRPSSAIRYLQIGERRLNEEQVQREFTEATVVFILWLTFLGISVAVLLRVISPAHPLEYVIFDVMSAQSNVGLDSRITGPTIPDTAKAMLIIELLAEAEFRHKPLVTVDSFLTIAKDYAGLDPLD